MKAGKGRKPGEHAEYGVLVPWKDDKYEQWRETYWLKLNVQFAPEFHPANRPNWSKTGEELDF